MQTQEKNRIPLRELLVLAVGEAVTCLLICGIYLAIGKFATPVLTGSILGAVCVLGNFIILTVTVNRAVDQVMEKRGSGEMTDEESERFAAEHKNEIAAAVKVSLLVRLGVFIAAIIVAGVTEWFDIVATVVPMLAWRPLLAVAGMMKQPAAKEQTVGSDAPADSENLPK